MSSANPFAAEILAPAQLIEVPYEHRDVRSQRLKTSEWIVFIIAVGLLLNHFQHGCEQQ